MKRVTAIVLSAVFAATALASCGEKKDPAPGSASGGDSSKEVTLNFYLWDQSMLEGVEERQAMVQKDNPHIRFENTVLPWGDYWTKLQTSLPSNSGPDVFENEANHTAEYGGLGFIEPLNSYIERDNYDMDAFYQGARALFTDLNSNIFAIPLNYDHTALYYNKNLFDAAQVDYPQEGITWDEFREKARALTVRDGDNVTQYGAIVGPNPQNGPYSFLLSNGCYPYGQTGTESNFKDPAFLETMQFLSDMIFEDRSAPTAKELVDLSADQLFINSMAAMHISAPATMDQYVEALGDGFDLVSMPVGKREGVSIMGMGICISAKSAHKEEAWETLKVFGSVESGKVEARKLCPANIQAQSAFADNFSGYNMSVFQKGGEIGEVIIPKYNMGVVDQHFQDMLGYIYSGDKPVSEAVDEADALVKQGFEK